MGRGPHRCCGEFEPLLPEVAWPVGPCVDLAHLADDPILDQLHGVFNPSRGMPLNAHLRDDPMPPGRFRQAPRLGNVVRQRLLRVDVFASAMAAIVTGDMRMIRSGNGDRIDVSLFQELAPIRVRACLRKRFSRLGQVRFIRVANRHDVMPCRGLLHVGPALTTHTHAGQVDLVVGRRGG